MFGPFSKPEHIWYSEKKFYCHFELFLHYSNYLNSLDQITLFGIRIRSIFKTKHIWYSVFSQNLIFGSTLSGCHQTNSDDEAMCSTKYASVHFRLTQIISGWRHGRARVTGIYWAVMREIEARVSVLRQGPSGSQFPDNVKIMSGKTAPAADFPLINYPTSGSRWWWRDLGSPWRRSLHFMLRSIRAVFLCG